jgi:DMSO/TMAO reductase YedYZ molybdopterin-dependent catalytic subunit
MTHLHYITQHPPNASVPLGSLDGTPLAQDQVYLRNSFPSPEPGRVTGEIRVLIPGRAPATLTPDRLAAMSQVTIDMVLECAGNGRSLMDPVPDGLPWGLGGVSPIRVGGVRLREALGAIPPEVVDVVFTGMDRGEVWPEGVVEYQFSIDADLARSGTPMLVTHLDGEPLSHDHGGPVRLVVPGHYAMKSVKWLTAIEGLVEPFAGHFVERYRYIGDHEMEDGAPVGAIRVRSVIARPEDRSRLPTGTVRVEGSAWSGAGRVTQVEVSTDQGRTWEVSDLAPGESEPAAAVWSIDLTLAAGHHTIIARATDGSGHTQPLRSQWNQRGYGNNLAHRVSIEVV